MELFSFKDVSYIADGQSILENLNFTINTNDFIMISGPSGSGKTTFLRMINHLVSPTSGHIFFNGSNIYSFDPVDLRKSISMCFQTPYLFGKNVKENLIYPYHIRKKHVDMEVITEKLILFNLNPDILTKDPRNLSGGEKQRISLIRTLLFPPQILLLDEITSALDEENTYIVEKNIKNHITDNSSILWITHNTRQFSSLGNRQINIENGTLSEVQRC